MLKTSSVLVFRQFQRTNSTKSGDGSLCIWRRGQPSHRGGHILLGSDCPCPYLDSGIICVHGWRYYHGEGSRADLLPTFNTEDLGGTRWLQYDHDFLEWAAESGAQPPHESAAIFFTLRMRTPVHVSPCTYARASQLVNII